MERFYSNSFRVSCL